MLEAELDINEIFELVGYDIFDTSDWGFESKTPTELEGIYGSLVAILKWEYENAKEILKFRLGLIRNLEVNRKWKPNRIPTFKTKVYVNGDPVQRILLSDGEVNIEKGNGKFYYVLARIGVKLLKKARKNWDIGIGKVLAEDRLEFLIREVYYQGFFNELHKLKQNLTGDFPVWQILYFRPRWIGEVSRGILLYYLSPNLTEEDRQIIEEYYLRSDYDELTPDEKLLKEIIEKRGRDLETEYYKIRDIVEIPLSSEIREKLRVKALVEKRVGKLNIGDRLIIPRWKFEDYLRFSPKKDLIESLLDLIRLKEIYKDVPLLREDIAKDRLWEKNYTRSLISYTA